MKILPTIFVFALSASIPAGNCFAGGEGTSAAAFLRVDTAARPAALGGAYCGLGNDLGALGYNIAGTGSIKEMEVQLAHAEWIEGVGNEFAAVACPLGKNRVLSVGLQYMHINGMVERDIMANPTGATFGASDGVYSVGISQRFGRVSMGVNGKAVAETVKDRGDTAYAVDLGILYRPSRRLRLGAALQNLGTPLKLAGESFPLPYTLRAGAGYAAGGGFLLGADIVKSPSSTLEARLGVEYRLLDDLMLRAGYKYTADANTGPGVSCGFGVVNGVYELDYALVPMGDFGLTHRISLDILFDVE